MPIGTTQRRAPLSQAAIEANRLGISLRAQGRLEEAAQAFERGAAAQDDVPELHLNLAETLTKLQRYDAARASYDRVLELRDDVNAHWALYELEQMQGNRAAALDHQTAALARQSIFSSYAPRQERRIAALMGPGDWQANVPIDYLVDPNTTTLHKVYLTDEQQAAQLRLPQADVVFTAIAQSSDNAARLQWAHDLVRRAGLPVVNAPLHVAAADRAAVYDRLRALPAVYVPQTRLLERAGLPQRIGEPILIRPVDSQAGRDLAKVGSSDELRAYLQRVEAPAFYVMPFVGYANADGYFRKYRIFVVDGKPYPCHLGISPDWMIHYYNAPMREHEWMREEERRFLTHFEDVFPQNLRDAMSAAARILELEYTGLDCSIASDGRLLLFEADPAMIVHAADDPVVFGYKHAAAHAIFDAFAKMIDRARSV